MPATSPGRLTVYEKPACSVCRELSALLEERGVAADRVDYHVTGLLEDELRRLVALTGGDSRALLRMREPLVRELRLADPGLDEDERLRLMAAHPQTVQRPIVVRGDRAVLARPVERVLELLD